MGRDWRGERGERRGEGWEEGGGGGRDKRIGRRVERKAEIKGGRERWEERVGMGGKKGLEESGEEGG